jgi:hypothetical protein
MAMTDDLKRIIEISERAQVIVALDISWLTKHDLIFSEDIIGAVHSHGNYVHYGYDIIKGYKNNVLGYTNALKEKAEELKEVIEAIEYPFGHHGNIGMADIMAEEAKND